jgi:OOP family OmpA-OmpF porin
MISSSRLFVLGALGLVAAGCASVHEVEPGLGIVDPTALDDADLLFVDYGRVRAMAPQGHPFVQGLRAGYLGLVDGLPEADLADRSHFGRKAVASAKGLNVQPDMVALRTVAAAATGELEAARARLMAALDGGGRRAAPDAAAAAQTAFDCWLERVEARDATGAARCRQAFESAIGEVERALTAGVDQVYIVFFAWDRADISPVAQEILRQVAEDVAAGRTARLVLAGHADRSGPEDYNMQLSERRARAVAAALIQLGVPAEAMELTWFGETMPRVPTEDGVREPQNRRVEITFE